MDALAQVVTKVTTGRPLRWLGWAATGVFALVTGFSAGVRELPVAALLPPVVAVLLPAVAVLLLAGARSWPVREGSG